MRRRCPECGRDPGDGSTCDECGAPVYRYAVESDEWEAANPDFDDAWDIDPEDLEIGDIDVPPPDPDLVPPPPVATPPLPTSSTRTRRPTQPERPADTVSPTSEAPAARRSGCRGCLVVVILIAVVGGALAFLATLLVADGTIEVGSGEGASSEVDPAARGECLDLLVEGSVVVDTIEVPCEEPHDAEAFHRVLLADGPFPGDEALASEADAACLQQFPDYVGTEYVESEYWLDSLVPTPDGWSLGDREVVCLLVSEDGSPLVGSGYRSGR